MIVKREYYTDKDGKEHEVLYTGKDSEHITGKVDRTISHEEPTPPEPSVDEQLLLNQAEILVNQEYANCLLEMNMEV